MYEGSDGDIASTDKIQLPKTEEANLHILRNAEEWFCGIGKDSNKLPYDFILCWVNFSLAHSRLSGAREHTKRTDHQSNLTIALEELLKPLLLRRENICI